MYTPRFSKEKAGEREEEEGGLVYTSSGGGGASGFGDQLGSVARSRAVESRQNQPPASQTADGKTNSRLCRFSKW